MNKAILHDTVRNTDAQRRWVIFDIFEGLLAAWHSLVDLARLGTSTWGPTTPSRSDDFDLEEQGNSVETNAVLLDVQGSWTWNGLLGGICQSLQRRQIFSKWLGILVLATLVNMLD